MNFRKLVAAPLVMAFALGACEDGAPTSPMADLDAIETVLASSAVIIEECTTVDFDGLAHGDAPATIEVLGVTLNLGGNRYNPTEAAAPTAYDVELTGAALAALNNTHDDTQAERLCNSASNGGLPGCVGHGRVLVVPDENFAAGGDNTEGGEITISGFASDPDPTAQWSISGYDVVDADANQGFTTLFVDAVQAAQNTKTGNATVEAVSFASADITDVIMFQVGDDDPLTNASGGIDNLAMCRTHEEQRGAEGCTPGYWGRPQHLDSWVGYDPADLVDDVFGINTTGTEAEGWTLLEAVNQKGNGNSIGQMLRHATAALLNAANPDVEYPHTEAEIIQMVQDAVAAGEFKTLKNELDAANNLGCSLD